MPTFPLSAAPAAPATPASTTFFPTHPPSFHTGSEKSSHASLLLLTSLAHTPWHMLSALSPEPAFSAGSAPSSSSADRHPTFPRSTAAPMGVSPNLFARLASAPAGPSTSTAIIRHASVVSTPSVHFASAVCPATSRESTRAPAATSAAAASTNDAAGRLGRHRAPSTTACRGGYRSIDSLFSSKRVSSDGGWLDGGSSFDLFDLSVWRQSSMWRRTAAASPLKHATQKGDMPHGVPSSFSKRSPELDHSSRSGIPFRRFKMGFWSPSPYSSSAFSRVSHVLANASCRASSVVRIRSSASLVRSCVNADHCVPDPGTAGIVGVNRALGSGCGSGSPGWARGWTILEATGTVSRPAPRRSIVENEPSSLLVSRETQEAR